MAHTLYIVATPIGNLEDISQRAIKTLQTVDLIACEDTRHSKKLLAQYDIHTPLIAFHEHNSTACTPKLIERLSQGENIALISDAGTPLISDPGFRLVQAAVQANIATSPIPGPCAAITALSASGLPCDRFSFEGFLPAKSQSRLNRLATFKHHTQTLIFYEAPHRIMDCLSDMLATFGGQRRACIARELTKLYETIKTDTLENLNAWVANDSNQRRGEFVVLIEGDKQQTDAELQHALDIYILLREELSMKQAVNLAAKITHSKKKSLYKAALLL
jgi:16S rRNA (cytidine1402-2'-O)-methyltransferase